MTETLIPLAEDEDGEHFYWDSKTGKVCFICRENVENPIPICNSVEAFIELLNNSCEPKGEITMVEYLPLGSIVLLQGGTQKALIIGRGLILFDGSENIFFDYGAVTYPEGLMGDQVVYFNHDKIGKVVFKGYSDIDDENAVDNIHRYLAEHPDLKKGDPASWNAAENA